LTFASDLGTHTAKMSSHGSQDLNEKPTASHGVAPVAATPAQDEKKEGVKEGVKEKTVHNVSWPPP
jgi:hypothetical protein